MTRRKRRTESDTGVFLRGIARMRLVIDREPDEAGLLALARRHKLNVYDAAYLELAVRQGLQLATLDSALVLAARAEGVALIGESAT